MSLLAWLRLVVGARLLAMGMALCLCFVATWFALGKSNPAKTTWRWRLAQVVQFGRSRKDQHHGNFIADRLEAVPEPGKAKKYEFLQV